MLAGAGSVSCVVSCQSDFKVVDVGDPVPVANLFCGDSYQNCHKRKAYDEVALASCFGILPEDLDALIAFTDGHCSSGPDCGDGGDCTVHFLKSGHGDLFSISDWRDTTCGCLERDEGAHGECGDCCMPPPQQAAPGSSWEMDRTDTWFLAGEDCLDQLVSCGLDVTWTQEETRDGCIAGWLLDCEWTVDCEMGDGMYSPQSEYSLFVDASVSTLTASPATGPTVSSQVSGGGSIGLAPTEFLSGLLWMNDSLTVDGTDFADWYFWFNTPIEFNEAAGTIVVPPSTGDSFSGQGTIDTVLIRADFGVPIAAIGWADTQQGAWGLDYSATLPDGTLLELELTGMLEATSQ